jgi:predicted alpha/beta superfamily hydrolase
VIALGAALAMAPVSGAQPDGEAVTIGVWRTIQSETLGEERRVLVSTPDGYASGSDPYVTIYLLDGDAHFTHTVGLVDFLVGNDLMPPAIVVAAPNTDRTRDLTPALSEPDAAFPTAGGAAAFREFLRDELMPFIDDEYRTREFRVLIGHSFGGLFALDTLVHEPDLFDGLIAISPSLQWDDQALVAQADAFFRETKSLPKSLYMTVGNEGGALLGGVLKFAGVLEEHAPVGFEWDSRVMEEETHNSVVHRSTRQGLEFVFRHWAMRDMIPVYERAGVEGLLAARREGAARYGVEREPGPETVFDLAAALATRGRLDEARAVLDFDPERFRPPDFFFMFLAGDYEDRGDTDGAVVCYRRALEINPGNDGARAALVALGVDPATIPAPPALDEGALALFAGTYADAGGLGSFVVRLEGGGLVIEGPRVGTSAMRYAGERAFMLTTIPVRIEFEGENGAAPTAMVVIPPDGSRIVFDRAPE